MFLNSLILKSFRIPKNSVVIILQGGIGNQIFQYFLGQELKEQFHKNVFYYDIRNSYATKHDSDIEKLFDLKLKKYSINKVNIIIRLIF